jgi:hypothetical protein
MEAGLENVEMETQGNGQSRVQVFNDHDAAPSYEP